MEIHFLETDENNEPLDFAKIKGFYIDPVSELYEKLSYIQTSIGEEFFIEEIKEESDDSEEELVEESKFFVELVSEYDPVVLSKRLESITKLSLNIRKIRWDFIDSKFVMKIGKIKNKDIYVIVATLLDDDITDETKKRIKYIKDCIVNGKKIEEDIVNKLVDLSTDASIEESLVEEKQSQEVFKKDTRQIAPLKQTSVVQKRLQTTNIPTDMIKHKVPTLASVKNYKPTNILSTSYTNTQSNLQNSNKEPATVSRNSDNKTNKTNRNKSGLSMFKIHGF